jgi:hypothetical protein
VVVPCSGPEFYVQEVTAEETSPVQKILPKHLDNDEMTRCGSVICDKKDHPIEKDVTLKFPWNNERIMAEFDGEATVVLDTSAPHPKVQKAKGLFWNKWYVLILQW